MVVSYTDGGWGGVWSEILLLPSKRFLNLHASGDSPVGGRPDGLLLQRRSGGGCGDACRSIRMESSAAGAEKRLPGTGVLASGLGRLTSEHQHQPPVGVRRTSPVARRWTADGRWMGALAATGSLPPRTLSLSLVGQSAAPRVHTSSSSRHSGRHGWTATRDAPRCEAATAICTRTDAPVCVRRVGPPGGSSIAFLVSSDCGLGRRRAREGARADEATRQATTGAQGSHTHGQSKITFSPAHLFSSAHRQKEARVCRPHASMRSTASHARMREVESPVRRCQCALAMRAFNGSRIASFGGSVCLKVCCLGVVAVLQDGRVHSRTQ